MFTSLNIVLFGVIALLGVGFYGLLITRNLIKVVLVLQILIKAVILAFILAGKMSGNPGLGQSAAGDAAAGGSGGQIADDDVLHDGRDRVSERAGRHAFAGASALFGLRYAPWDGQRRDAALGARVQPRGSGRAS